MSDNDLIRRGDALAAIQLGDTVTKLQARIRAIPYVDADPACTCCGGTGITYQTEGRCACQGPDLSDPVVVHANMLRGTIAKPTIEQIVHLYGSEAFQPMIDAATAKALEKACLAVSEHADWPEDEHGRTEQVGLFARVIDAILAISPAVTPAPDHEALLKWLDSFPPPNEKVRQMWAEYQRAVGDGRLRASVAQLDAGAIREAADVIKRHGAEATATAMILHIAETLRDKGKAVLTTGDDFGAQVLQFAEALLTEKPHDRA